MYVLSSLFEIYRWHNSCNECVQIYNLKLPGLCYVNHEHACLLQEKHADIIVHLEFKTEELYFIDVFTISP